MMEGHPPFKADLEDFLQRFARIPPAQRVVASLIHLMEAGDPDVEQISEIIRLDSALSSQVLRMSNSAFYAMQVPADSIDEAIIRLGFSETIKLANLAALTVLTQTERIPVYPLNREALWEMSVVAASLMSMLAHQHAVKPEMAYSAGLLHGIGRWVISQCLDELGKGTVTVPDGSLLEMVKWEERSTGYNYATIGGMAMVQWNYPDNLRGCIEHHMTPLRGGPHVGVACMLNTAVKGAAHLCLGERNPLDKLRFDDEVLLRAGVDFDTLIDELLPAAKEDLHSTYDLLRSGKSRRLGDL